MLYTRRDFIKKATIATAGISAANTATLGQSHYLVQKGDTLSHIARRFNTTVAELKSTNGLKSDLIQVGQTIYVSLTTDTSINFLTKANRITKSLNVRRNNWSMIVVHHSAIKHGNAAVYDKAHRRRGMENGLAYHFVIGNGLDSGDGEVEVGPRWKQQLHGGHVRSYKVNLVAIGICMVGNFEKTKPSQRQMLAFVQLVDWLQNDILRKKVKFAGHKDIEQNLCPGKHFPLAAMHRRYS